MAAGMRKRWKAEGHEETSEDFEEPGHWCTRIVVYGIADP